MHQFGGIDSEQFPAHGQESFFRVSGIEFAARAQDGGDGDDERMPLQAGQPGGVARSPTAEWRWTSDNGAETSEQ